MIKNYKYKFFVYFNMETTKNEIPQYAKEYFFKLGNYLDTPIYFYTIKKTQKRECAIV